MLLKPSRTTGSSLKVDPTSRSTACTLAFKELTGCPVCDAERTDREWLRLDLLHGIPGRFRYVCCAACRTVYQNPRVTEDDLPKCYPGSYYTHVRPAERFTAAPTGSPRDRLRKAVLSAAAGRSAEDLKRITRVFGAILATVPPIRRRARFGLPDELALRNLSFGRCLEVGPGQGMTLAQLRAIGWQAIGLDPDPQAARTAADFSGCDVLVGTLTSIDLPPESFDLIYMSHVLEHIPDLKSALHRCYELLAPGGRLVAVYPNPESLGAQWNGEYSPVWDPPRHLVLPPGSAIHQILSQIGFRPVRVGTSARTACWQRMTARYYRTRSSEEPSVPKPRWADRLFHFTERLLVALGMPVGEEIVVVALKPE